MTTVSAVDRDKWLGFLDRQIQLAYERNKEVGEYQKGTMRLLFSFYAVILGALVFADVQPANSVFAKLGTLSYLIPALVLLVGLAFWAMYLNYELYTKIYKGAMKDLEGAICEILTATPADITKYKITYYARPDGHPAFAAPTFALDPGFLFAMAVAFLLNHGIAIVVLRLAGSDGRTIVVWVIISLLVHALSWITIYCWQRGRIVRSTQPASRAPQDQAPATSTA